MNILLIFPDLLDIERQGESTLISTAYRSHDLMEELGVRCDQQYGPTKAYSEYLLYALSMATKIVKDDTLSTNDYIQLVADIATNPTITINSEKFSWFDGIIYTSLGCYDNYRILCPKCTGEGCEHCSRQYTIKETLRQIRKSDKSTLPIEFIELDLTNRERFVEKVTDRIGAWFYER